MNCNLGLRLFEKVQKIPLFICTNLLHSSNALYSSPFNTDRSRLKWPKYNDVIYPPQAPDEPRRPGYVCHVAENVKYSYKKMWYIACLVRGMTIDEALKQLLFVQRKGADIARKTLLEAQEMAVKDHNIEFKTNLWVSESFVGKSDHLTGFRRSAFGKMKEVKFGYIHYFVTLEEGTPPQHYYQFKRPKSGPELLEEWVQEMRNRRVYGAL